MYETNFLTLIVCESVCMQCVSGCLCVCERDELC